MRSVHFVTNDVNCPRIDNSADLPSEALRVIWSEATQIRLHFRDARNRIATLKDNDARVPFAPVASSLVYIWTLSSAPKRLRIFARPYYIMQPHSAAEPEAPKGARYGDKRKANTC